MGFWGLLAAAIGIYYVVQKHKNEKHEAEAQKEEAPASSLANSGFVKECVQAVSVMRVLHLKAEAPMNIFCVNLLTGFLLELKVKDSRWAYSIEHFDDMMIDTEMFQLSYGEAFQQNTLQSALEEAKQQDNTLNNVDNFSELNLMYALSPDDGEAWVVFRKRMLIPGSKQSYCMALKKVMEEKYPSDMGSHIEIIF